MQRQGFIGGSGALRVRVTGILLLVAHLVFVAWYALRPLDVPWVPSPNLRPLAGVRADLALGPGAALRSLGGALALLAPLGVLLPMANGRLAVSPAVSLLRTTAAGALLSLGVELLQTGVPGQVVDVDDLLLNTLGVALAHLAVVPACRARLRRRCGHGQWRGSYGRGVRRASGEGVGEEPSQGRTPTIPRVGIAP